MSNPTELEMVFSRKYSITPKQPSLSTASKFDSLLATCATLLQRNKVVPYEKTTKEIVNSIDTVLNPDEISQFIHASQRFEIESHYPQATGLVVTKLLANAH